MSRDKRRRRGAETNPVNLQRHYNWPRGRVAGEFLRDLAKRVRQYPAGKQTVWGIPFEMGDGKAARVVIVAGSLPDVVVKINSQAHYLCVLHTWVQSPPTVQRQNPREGLIVGEYILTYSDGSQHAQPMRARFEVTMQESPGPAWLAMPFAMPQTIDSAQSTEGVTWGRAQFGLYLPTAEGKPRPLVYAMPNPHPRKTIRSVTFRGLQESPLLVAALTLYRGTGHPLRHLPRRTYRIGIPGGPARIKTADVDLGLVARIEKTPGPRGKAWMTSPYRGTWSPEPERSGEHLVEIVAAEDARLTATVEGNRQPLTFSVGEAFACGTSRCGRARMEVLGRERQWVTVRVTDGSTGRLTPVRIHFSGGRGEYLAPHGHHAQINANWFEDYGADVVVGGRQYAYVPGEFVTELPVGDLFVEIVKGFEYAPVRTKVRLQPGQKVLNLRVSRWKDLRSQGWVTADTHVHFISPHTAWLEAQCEGVNVVNLLASQWGRLFTNVGDYPGRAGIVEDDTIVYVGTENRHHMLGHMSMLGTKGLPVYPMCCGGPTESWVGDPDFRLLAEWAQENRRKGGLSIRPHFPYCGFTEDPVPILKGLVDALEINPIRDGGFPVQEWYRYLNCGYRVAVVGGTDKMGAYTALGWMRTYAKLDPRRPFTYDNWTRAVRAGRTVTTNGPLLDLIVEGQGIGSVIRLPAGGGSVEVEAVAESAWPLERIEIVVNGAVAAAAVARQGSGRLRIRERIRLAGSGWIAARCSGRQTPASQYLAAHTSPVYADSGGARPFDAPAAQHMLTLVEGGVEYLNTLATVYDEASRKRMVKWFQEAQQELKARLVIEGPHGHTHGSDGTRVRGHRAEAGHRH
jgi:hypothetical protein